MLLLDSLRPPFRHLIGGFLAGAGLLGLFGLFGLFQLGIRFAVPSDPCPPGDLDCLSGDRAWLGAGLISLALAIMLLGTALVLVMVRRRMRFVVPPGWPVPPAGWRPTAGWEPDLAWPAPPDGWTFWRRR